MVARCYAVGLIGLPGSGKSTLARALSGRFRVAATSTFHDPDSRMAWLIEQVHVRGSRELALACQVEGLARRAQLCAEADEQTVVDEPLFSVAAHSRAMRESGLLSEPAYLSWRSMYDYVALTTPRPRLLVRLVCDWSERRRRVGSRGRPRDSKIERVYLDQFERGLVAETDAAAASGVPTLILDSTCLTSEELVVSVMDSFTRTPG
jgi:deoxyadenosine/deoxycytidine kinase